MMVQESEPVDELEPELGPEPPEGEAFEDLDLNDGADWEFVP
jgi:hypothetical protein